MSSNRPFRVSGDSFLMYAFWWSRNDRSFYSCQHCCAVAIFKIFIFSHFFQMLEIKWSMILQWSKLYLAFILEGLFISLGFTVFLFRFYWRREICIKTQKKKSSRPHIKYFSRVCLLMIAFKKYNWAGNWMMVFASAPVFRGGIVPLG